jgi:RNA polymerase sigma-70 factor (ECF subfamily)
MGVEMNNELLQRQKYSGFESEIVPQLNSLKNYALKMTRDFDESEDLVQNTLLKAFRFFGSFQKGSNIKAWLFAIMTNSFINNYRKKNKQPFKIDYDDVQNFYEKIKSEEVKIAHYQNDAFSNILDDDFTDAISKLPDEFRTIIFLSDIEGYSYKEIADFVDCPVGTVRSRLHRARKILYNLLYKYALQNGFVRLKANNNTECNIMQQVEVNS